MQNDIVHTKETAVRSNNSWLLQIQKNQNKNFMFDKDIYSKRNDKSKEYSTFCYFSV